MTSITNIQTLPADMTQYFARTSKELAIHHGVPKYDALAGFENPSEPARVAMYSPDGSRLAYATATATYVVDPDSGALQATVPVSAADLYFSPKGTYVVTWVRSQKNPDTGNWTPNLKVWAVAAPQEPVAEFVQTSQGSFRGGWSVQFTADEKFAVHQSGPGTLSVYDGSLGGKPLSTLDIPDGIAEFSVSSGRNPAVAVFVLGKKGRPASARIYKLPSVSHPIAQRTFFKAETVKLMWNKLGTALLVLATTDVDQSGKSYYGESTLYLLSTNNGADQRIMLDKEGPIHDVNWSGTSDEFGVVYGFMPSKTTFFDSRGNEIHSLPVASRNAVLYSPQGKFVLVAGFGNLQGTMDVYDRSSKFSKVATIQASNTSYFEWSPDGRYILTATTSPRLRVDNGIKLWHYTGKFMYNHDDEELFSVAWRPQEVALDLTQPIADPHNSVSDKPVPVAEKPKGAYRPPHARSAGGPDVARLSLYQRSMVTTEAAPELSKAAAKNKKKRENKKTDGPAGQASNESTSATVGAPSFGSTATPEEKQIRSLLKKLRAITELKERQAAGDELEATQVQKINTEKEVVDKLQSLGWSG